MAESNDWKSDTNIILSKYLFEPSWKILFNKLFEDPRFKEIEDYLNNNKHIPIFPYPQYIFHAFNTIKIDQIHTVILGQDPYHNIVNSIPQAMGLAFSVPSFIRLPSSLRNIFNNMKSYGHIPIVPKNGDLTFLTNQGCLLMNSSLTVFQGKPNSHYKLWEWFTDSIIEYLSKNHENLIFVLWGSFAYKKIKLIDVDRHKIIITSHPSGLSYKNPMNIFPAFNDIDQFGKINEYLKELNKPELIFDSII
jgi:uracil-DNA glycosylase